MAHPINMALYRYLVAHGADEQQAEAAARLDASELVTKQDLTLAIAELKADLQRVIIHAMLGMTAIFSIIVGLLRIFT